MHPLDIIRQAMTVTAEQEQYFRSLAQEKIFRRGDTVRGTANFSTYAFYILSGAARVYYVERGKERTVSFTTSDQFILIPRSLVSDHPDTLSIEFLETTQVLFLPVLQMREFIEGNYGQPRPEVLMFLNAALVHYSRYLEERIHVLQDFTAAEQYAWFTRRYPSLIGVATDTQIASFLGMARETLYRLKK